MTLGAGRRLSAKVMLAITIVPSRMAVVPKKYHRETKAKTARGLFMGRLLLNKCLSLLWAVAMATAMIAKCECGGCSVAAS